MFRHVLRILFDDSQRGDDRACDPLLAAGTPYKPPVLRRRTINLIGLGCIAVITYGTFVPFQFEPVNTLTWRLPWYGLCAGDAAANVLLYVPIGAFLRLFFRRRGTHWITECGWALLTAAGISYTTEVLQTICPYRVPALADTACNFGGAILGITFAPLFQRMVRNAHAWIFRNLHIRPFTAGAVIITACIWIYALAPFDPHPTLPHLQNAVRDVLSAKTILPFGGGFGGDSALSVPETIDKVADASVYGLLALFLLLSMREAGKAAGAAAWYALTRSVAMTAAIELLQLFTMAHVTDPADLTAGWICCGAAVAVGFKLVRLTPDLHRRPMLVLRWLVTIATVVLVLSRLVMLALDDPASTSAPLAWLPLVSNFHRTWNSVLGDYARGLMEYAIVAGLLVAWARAVRRRPWAGLVIVGPIALALITMIVSLYLGVPTDTAQLLLALAAGLVAVKADRVLFERRQAVPQTIPAEN